MPSNRLPSYRLHRPTGQAVVTLSGRDFYLGKWDTKASRQEYDRLIGEWLANGRRLPTAASNPDLRICELLSAYLEHARAYYPTNGSGTGEFHNMQEVAKGLARLYSRSQVVEFGPLSLKSLRQSWIEQGICRRQINARTHRVRRIFRWGVENELVPAAVLHALKAVGPLREGKTEARETQEIEPVADLYVAVVLPFVTPVVASMMMVQRLTGMRSSELCAMRPCDIDTTEDVWIYTVGRHKSQWRGRRKLVPLGPAVQRIIRPFMQRDAEAFLFSPRESEQWRFDHRPPYHGRERKTPVYPSELRRRERLKQARRRRQPKSPKRTHYSTDTFRSAVEYGMKKAWKAGYVFAHWHPHQLRHTLGTQVRQTHGIEAAQAVLGHAKADVTEIYAQKDIELAKRVARETG